MKTITMLLLMGLLISSLSVASNDIDDEEAGLNQAMADEAQIQAEPEPEQNEVQVQNEEATQMTEEKPLNLPEKAQTAKKNAKMKHNKKVNYHKQCKPGDKKCHKDARDLKKQQKAAKRQAKK